MLEMIGCISFICQRPVRRASLLNSVKWQYSEAIQEHIKFKSNQGRVCWNCDYRPYRQIDRQLRDSMHCTLCGLTEFRKHGLVINTGVRFIASIFRSIRINVHPMLNPSLFRGYLSCELIRLIVPSSHCRILLPH